MIQSLYTGLSALKSFQTGLDITSHNIANVNTKGYSSQRVLFEDTLPGVKVSSIERSEDPFIFHKYLKDLKQKTDTDINNSTLSELNNKVNDKSLNNLLDSFYNEIQSLKNDSSLDKNPAKNIGRSFLERTNNLNNIFSSELSDIDKMISLNESLIEEKTKEFDKLIKEQPSNEIKDKIDSLKKELTILNTDNLKELKNTISAIQNKFNESLAPLKEQINKFLETEDPSFVDTSLYNSEFQVEFKSLIPSTEYTNAIFSVSEDKYMKVSNVNLDREMVNLLIYQRSYQAAAKVIQVSDEILKTTLDLKS